MRVPAVVEPGPRVKRRVGEESDPVPLEVNGWLLGLGDHGGVIAHADVKMTPAVVAEPALLDVQAGPEGGEKLSVASMGSLVIPMVRANTLVDPPGSAPRAVPPNPPSHWPPR